jgi:tRNA (cmo5U34)-methyltransferase
MSTYRWNTDAFAEGYDQAAHVIHPYYLDIQEAILAALPGGLGTEGFEPGRLVVDLGGGSGRLVERILDRWPVSAIVIDQSEPFLALAERRLSRFGPRAVCILARLQDRWIDQLPAPSAAIVSMSAIHHLEPSEKQALYRQCFEALAPDGVLLNGDEVRDENDHQYRAHVSAWADHMMGLMQAGTVPSNFNPALEKWIDRNVTRFGEPKKSGDDCHETIATQLDYLTQAGFAPADCPWRQSMWALLRGHRPK